MLKGWEYKDHAAVRIIKKGETVKVYDLNETGWLYYVGVITDDCYAGMKIKWQGADLESMETEMYPGGGTINEPWWPDPSGYQRKYYRPDPNSSAGIYNLVGFGGGPYGALLPYIPTVEVSLFLKNASTQSQANVMATANVIAITKKELFIRSLRAVLGIKDMEIDPFLIVQGPSGEFGGKK